MTEYLTEQEQIELLKSWIKQYSLVVLLGILFAVGASSLWHYWQQYKENILIQSSAIYNTMLNDRIQNNVDKTRAQAKKLYTQYPKTPYAQMGALLLARTALLAKDYAAAKNYLQWVIDQSATPALREIARLRLARLLLAEQKPNDALSILEITEDTSFNGLIDEIRGDAYLQLKKRAQAQKFYERAKNELPNSEVMRPILQMKYDNLNISKQTAS